MGKKQTAVDLFYDFIKIHCDNDVELYETCVLALKQAKQMEKEQIINAHLAGVEMTIDTINKYEPVPKILNVLYNIKNGIEIHEDGEDYYKETYAQQ